MSGVLPFGRRVRSAERARVSGILTIWEACVQCRERVFLPFGKHVCSADRGHVSGCSYHLAGVRVVLSSSYHFGGMCAVLSGCT